MGWWGQMAFDNDEALDWAGDLFEFETKTPVEVVDELRRVLREALRANPIDVRTGTLAIPAAEIVAASRGRRRAHLPDYVNAWVKKHGNLLGTQDARLAMDALFLLTSIHSGVTRMWQGDDLTKFERYLNGLRVRVKNACRR